MILNYVTAWQMIHRVAKPGPGQTALVTGAAGGVGTAARQLFRLAGLKTYGAASAPKHDLLRSLGATPIDYRTAPLDRLTRALEPEGVDYVFDAVGESNSYGITALSSQKRRSIPSSTARSRFWKENKQSSFSPRVRWKARSFL